MPQRAGGMSSQVCCQKEFLTGSLSSVAGEMAECDKQSDANNLLKKTQIKAQAVSKNTRFPRQGQAKGLNIDKMTCWQGGGDQASPHGLQQLSR